MLYAYYGSEDSEAAATAAFHQQHYNVHELEAVTEDNLNAALQVATGNYGYSYGVDTIDVEGNAILNGIVSFSGSYSGLGDVVIDRQNISYKVSGDEIIVTVPVIGSVTDKEGNPKTAEIEVIFTNDIFLTVESCTLNIDQTIGELMGKAAMDTVMGMGTVFLILILISLIIWALGGIPKLQEKLSGKQKKEAVQAAPAADSTAVQTVVEENGDDLELIAVIAAAIAASEGAAGTDGFVVRSIRKRR
ncbi:MAG: OadG family protein [Lachnospiraceae bacterium]|nr:OadG family protein [Lachnospiraceae bacterium]